MNQHHIVILILLSLTLSLNAQKWELVRPRNVPWGQVALSMGTAAAAVSLEMAGDAVYDMGKEAHDVSQMKLGHTLQAMGNATPFVALPVMYFIARDDHSKWYWDALFSTATYMGIRFGIADGVYNSYRGLPFFYSGTTSTMDDNFMSQFDDSQKGIAKGFSISIVFVFNISYL